NLSINLSLFFNQLETISGLDKLRKLQTLVLDNNRLTSVFKDISTLRRLEVLRCSRNNLKEIPRNIRQMKALVDLDVSENRISILPTDIFMLPKLDVFNASQNQIAKVPSFNVRPQSKHWVTHIDLSENKLAQFPGHLLQMTSKLDLSGNNIKTLPYHSIKKLDVSTSQQLLLEDNPLGYPPAHVCCSGLKNVISFFQESQAEIKVYQGVKVLIVGPFGSGKTSLVQTLVDQQPRMSEEIQDTSGGIDTYEMAFDLEEADALEGRPGKSLEVRATFPGHSTQLSIWDFCGHPFYMYPHYVFFEQPTITILTFNMAAYTAEAFEEQIGCWFDWMIAKTNKIVVILVGTQCDLLSKAQLTKRDFTILLLLLLAYPVDDSPGEEESSSDSDGEEGASYDAGDDKDEYESNASNNQRQSVGQNNNSSSNNNSEELVTSHQFNTTAAMMAEERDSGKNFVEKVIKISQAKNSERGFGFFLTGGADTDLPLAARYTVQTDVICTSAKKFIGFDRLRQAIESLAGDRQLFPNVMRVIPTFWLDVQHYIEARNGSRKCAVSTRPQVGGLCGGSHLQVWNEAQQDRGNALSLPVLKWEEFVEEVTSRFGMKHLMKAIAQYLHETGQIMWFSNIESLKGLVFIRPSWLFDVFRSIFRHDFEDATFTPDDNLRAAGLSSIKFERLKQEALSEGIIDRDLLRCLLSPLIPADLVSPATEVMRLLTEAFELGYSVSKRQRDSVFSLTPDVGSEGKAKLGKILIPWLRRNDEPEDFREMWDEKEGNRKLAVYFRFPHYFPPGLFEIISVRAYKPGHSLRFKHHWGGGFHAFHATEKVHVVVSYAWVEGEGEDTKHSQGKDKIQEHAERTAFSKGNSEHDKVIKRVRKKKVVIKETLDEDDDQFEADASSLLDHLVDSPRTFTNDDINPSENSIVPKEEYTHVGVQKDGDTVQQRVEPEPGGESARKERHVMLKYEVRDQSGDEAELTPAAAMWTLLLPLLMEVEELLNAYPGKVDIYGFITMVGGSISAAAAVMEVEELLNAYPGKVDIYGFLTVVKGAMNVERLSWSVEVFLLLPLPLLMGVEAVHHTYPDDILRDVMRKSRAARRGGAVTSQLLAGTQQVAPPNPRRVGVTYSELDVQEGMASLAGMLGEERSNSLVAELAAGAGEGAESDQEGGARGGYSRQRPIDLDVEQVRLLQEIRKASSQLTLDSFSDTSARNSLGGGAFFMTRGGSAGAADDEEEGEARGRRRGQPRDSIPEEDIAHENSRAAGFLEGLAEFQRRIGVRSRNNAQAASGRIFSRTTSNDSYEYEETEENEEEIFDGADLEANALPPGLKEFQQRLRQQARFSIASDETEDEKM
ncbi:hypothetical protein EGW08_019433, partial [Elysia chlorotica]